MFKHRSIWGMPAGGGCQSLTIRSSNTHTHTHTFASFRWPKLGWVSCRLLWPVLVSAYLEHAASIVTFGGWLIVFVCALSVCWKHICLIETAALSDFCLFSFAVYNFSYIYTYSFTHLLYLLTFVWHQIIISNRYNFVSVSTARITQRQRITAAAAATAEVSNACLTEYDRRR